MRRSRVSGLIVAVATLALAACGAGNTPPTGTALAALIQKVPLGPVTPGWKASCVGHSCTVAWDQPGSDARKAWVFAFPEVAGIDAESRFFSVHHLNVRIADPDSGRVWVIACRLNHKLAEVSGVYSSTSYMRKFCIERKGTPSF